MVSINNSVAEFMDLNDDVLEQILSNLNIFEQFKMGQLNSRLLNIVNTVWNTRRNTSVYNVTLRKDMFVYNNAKLEDQVFIDFMVALKPTMSRLVLFHMDVKKLRLLSQDSFDMIHTFEWFSVRREDLYDDSRYKSMFNNEDVKMVQRMLPNLQTLRLQSCAVTAQYMSSMPTLRTLTLDGCELLDPEYMGEIFQKIPLMKLNIMNDYKTLSCCDLVNISKCSTLEHIKMADYHLCAETNILYDILRMPKLRKLSIYAENDTCGMINRMTQQSIRQIEAFKYTGALNCCQRLFYEIGKFSHLQKLFIYIFHGIEYKILENLSTKYPKLQELHICDCHMESFNGILQFVLNCYELRLINITGSQHIGDQFIFSCMELLKKRPERTEPLEIYIMDTDIDQNITKNPRFIPNEKLLKINTKRLMCDSCDPSMLKFTLASI